MNSSNFSKRYRDKAGLQITVSHRTLADPNLLVSSEILTVVGRDVWTICFIVNHFKVRMHKNLP